MIQAVIILVLSICVHEFGHAIIAHKLGDGTPKSQGRVTLNPMAHSDPIGTLAFPIIALLATGGKSLGFGWGRPVMINPTNFTRRYETRVSHMMVAFAGPVMNVILGVLIIVTHVILMKQQVLGYPDFTGGIPQNLSAALWYASLLNFVLFFFNLIPAPPLDGGAVLEGLLPRRLLPDYQRFKVYGPFILMGVILIPGAHKIVSVPARWVHEQLFALLM